MYERLQREKGLQPAKCPTSVLVCERWECYSLCGRQARIENGEVHFSLFLPYHMIYDTRIAMHAWSSKPTHLHLEGNLGRIGGARTQPQVHGHFASRSFPVATVSAAASAAASASAADTAAAAAAATATVSRGIIGRVHSRHGWSTNEKSCSWLHKCRQRKHTTPQNVVVQTRSARRRKGRKHCTTGWFALGAGRTAATETNNTHWLLRRECTVTLSAAVVLSVPFSFLASLLSGFSTSNSADFLFK